MFASYFVNYQDLLYGRKGFLSVKFRNEMAKTDLIPVTTSDNHIIEDDSIINAVLESSILSGTSPNHTSNNHNEQNVSTSISDSFDNLDINDEMHVSSTSAHAGLTNDESDLMLYLRHFVVSNGSDALKERLAKTVLMRQNIIMEDVSKYLHYCSFYFTEPRMVR